MTVTFAVTQFAVTQERAKNIATADLLVRRAAAAGAQVICLQELFETVYFCQNQRSSYFAWAQPLEGNPVIKHFSKLAAELSVVLPVPFFERSNNAFFNSVAVVDADGSLLGLYRKSHIPDGPGYSEKFYFSPGDSGFRVFDTRYGRLGIAICWDQWFPEAARALALQGAEYILYPTAIGNEPQDASANSYPHWVRTMQGHAAANLVPIVVSNRIGTEVVDGSELTFFGGSFIAGPRGEIVAQVGASSSSLEDGTMSAQPTPCEGFATFAFDLDQCRHDRVGWGVFRDRRPQLYGALMTLDGKSSTIQHT